METILFSDQFENEKTTSISLYDTRVQLCRARVLRLFGQRAAAWERIQTGESDFFFSANF